MPVDDGCTSADHSLLAVKAPGPFERALVWAWSGNSADPLGDPVRGTTYAFCVYDTDDSDAGPHLVISAVVPPGPGWSAGAGKLMTYFDPSGVHGGIKAIAITAPGIAPRGIVLEGGGEHLALPPPGANLLAERPYVTAQLLNSAGGCWQALYASPADASNSRLFSDHD